MNILKYFKAHKLLEDGEDIEDFFAKPYDTNINKINAIFQSRANYYEKGIYSKQYLMIISSFFFLIYKSSRHLSDYQSRMNAEYILEWINKKIIFSLTPLLLSFFIWDFNRRTWDSQKYANTSQIDYIKRTILEIESELEGKSNEIIKKYIYLASDFIIEYFDNVIKNFEIYQDEISNELPSFKGEFNKKKFIETRMQLSELINQGMIEELADQQLEETASNYLHKKSKFIKDGLLKFSNVYDFFVDSFVSALIDYKAFLKYIYIGIEDSLETEIQKIKLALFKGDYQSFISVLKILFASISSELIKNTSEAYYHVYTFLVLKLAGLDVISEDSTNLGRIDLSINTPNYLYILEFKLDSKEKAVQQIKERKYYEKYLLEGKKIICGGIAFDKTTKNIKEDEFWELS